MKTLNTLFALLLFASVGMAQSETDSTAVKMTKSDTVTADTTKIELKNAYITIISKGEKVESNDWDWEDGIGDEKYQLAWWNGIDLGFNGMVGPDYDLKFADGTEGLRPDVWRSRYIAFNFAQVKARIVKDYVGLTTGLTFQIYSWKYDGGNEFSYGNDSLYITENTSKNITKNKLRAEYLGIPLMLEFNTSLDPDRAFHISVGAVGKVRLGNMYKQKFDQDGDKNKTTIKGDFGFNRWQVDAMARIGYKRLTIYGQVGLLPLFEADNVDDIYSFSAGFFIKI